MQLQSSNEADSKDGRSYFRDGDRRRTLRIKRSGLQQNGLRDLDRPAIKFAENRVELVQAFMLVYQVYLQKGFITSPKPHEMLYSIYSLLPETVHIVAKSYLTVISNLSVIFDTPEFGLPMDAIYNKELDELRGQGRKVVELSALATPTPREHRWKNIYHFLVQTMYWYARYRGVNDVCIAVNPRHVRYYQALFPFRELGPERHYSRVDAPAVALRGKMENSRELMMEIGEKLEFDTPLDPYFEFMARETADNGITGEKAEKNNLVPLDTETVRYFIQKDPGILADLTPEQKRALNDWYPGLDLG